MFIVLINYIKPFEIVEQYIAAHRAFLDEGYKNNCFVASGPQVPRTGGVIISQLKDRALLESILQNDPYQLQQIADYQIIEFNPVKYHEGFLAFIN